MYVAVKQTRVYFPRMNVTKSKTLLSFGKRVREIRLAKGLSQEQLAFACGLHRTHIGMIERAERNISLLTMEKLAIGLNISISVFFQDNGKNTRVT